MLSLRFTAVVAVFTASLCAGPIVFDSVNETGYIAAKAGPRTFFTLTRWGDGTTYGKTEYGLGSNNSSANANSRQLNWTSGTAESFTLTYDANTGQTTFAYADGYGGTNPLQYAAPVGGFGTLAVAMDVNATQSVSLTNLMLNGTALDSLSLNGTSTAGAAGRWLGSSVLFANDFTLRGDVVFTWTANTQNEKPRLWIEGVGSPVPEPGTYGVIGVGLAALAIWKRKRS